MKKNTTKKTSIFKSKNVKSSFTGTKLTKHAGLSPIMKYIDNFDLGQDLNELFPTTVYNSTKFSNAQILMALILASFSGVNRLIKIATFTFDSLVMVLLGLDTGLNKDVIGVRLKALGQSGAIKLQEFLFDHTRTWLKNSSLEKITLDVDSTVQLVCGNQQGAAKGFNPKKRGAKSYHPLIAFLSEKKLVLNSWFRTGSAYTSNGICEFIKQCVALLPPTINDVFFRADSGFFNGVLFDLLEELGWTYLVKVKLKNLKTLLGSQIWHVLENEPHIAICEFDYKAKSWKKSRKLRAIRTIKKWEEVEFMGSKQFVPVYEYACYCSNLDLDAYQLHEIYKQRSTSETWIEQVKSQLLAGATLTDNFHANDILWQLNVFAYNLSVMMRSHVKKIWQQEHATFRDWFINLPAKIVEGSRFTQMKIYKNYYFKDKWKKFETSLLLNTQ
ncbi:IS1380 family transposase [candidate division KSB1 bacterium]|nr:IS1380 family transposase [candidate division KSB1 bacterium]